MTRKSSFARRLTLFFAPIAVSVMYILMMYWLMPRDLFKIIGLLLLTYFLAPFGREVLIPVAVIALLELHGASYMGADIFMIVTTIVFVDVLCSIFLLWNLDLLKLVPRLGKWIEGIERYGKSKLRKSRWKRYGIFVGLTAYVAVPFQGTNGAASTLLGLLAGMRKARIWLAVWIGSIIGSLAIAVLAFSLGQQFPVDFFKTASWKAMSLLFSAGIFIYLILNYYRYRTRKGISS